MVGCHPRGAGPRRVGYRLGLRVGQFISGISGYECVHHERGKICCLHGSGTKIGFELVGCNRRQPQPQVRLGKILERESARVRLNSRYPSAFNAQGLIRLHRHDAIGTRVGSQRTGLDITKPGGGRIAVYIERKCRVLRMIVAGENDLQAGGIELRPHRGPVVHQIFREQHRLPVPPALK